MAKHHPDLIMCMKQPGIGAAFYLAAVGGGVQGEKDWN
jgi:hypothetical protein